jgi:hypothetical protein
MAKKRTKEAMKIAYVLFIIYTLIIFIIGFVLGKVV